MEFLGILIQLAVNAILLLIAMSVAGGAGKSRNTFGRAFGTAAILAVVMLVVSQLLPVLVLFVPLLALFILKSMYGIGWLRAILVSIVLFVIWVFAAIFIYAPLSLMGAGFKAVFGV